MFIFFFMLKRNFIFLVALAAIVGSVNAQVRPGLKLGYNYGGISANYLGREKPNDFSTNAGDPNNFGMKSGFQGGFIADCPINDVWAIQPGARFAMQGFTDRYRNAADNLRTFSFYYLQVPVYAQYRLNFAEDANVLFQAGPYAEFGLFGRQSWSRGGNSQDLNDNEKKKTFGSGNDIQERFSYGLGFGAGIEFYRFQLMVAYDFGLNQSTLKMDNIRTKSGTYHVDMRNHNFSITLAVIFGRRDPLQNQRD